MSVPYLVKAEATTASNDEIMAKVIPLATSLGFKPRDDLHCTLIFARTYKKVPALLICYPVICTYKVSGVSKFGKAIVLLLEANENSFLVKRHHQLKIEMGATTDHPTYEPHVTIGYCDKPIDLKAIEAVFVGMKVSFDREKGKEFA